MTPSSTESLALHHVPFHWYIRSHSRIRFLIPQQATSVHNRPLLFSSCLTLPAPVFHTSNNTTSALPSTAIFALHLPSPFSSVILEYTHTSSHFHFQFFHPGHPDTFRTRISSRLFPHSRSPPNPLACITYLPLPLACIYFPFYDPGTNPQNATRRR